MLTQRCLNQGEPSRSLKLRALQKTHLEKTLVKLCSSLQSQAENNDHLMPAKVKVFDSQTLRSTGKALIYIVMRNRGGKLKDRCSFPEKSGGS